MIPVSTVGFTLPRSYTLSLPALIRSNQLEHCLNSVNGFPDIGVLKAGVLTAWWSRTRVKFNFEVRSPKSERNRQKACSF